MGKGGDPGEGGDDVGCAVGFQNTATGLDLGSTLPLVFADKAAQDGPALDPLLGEVGGGVVWPGGRSRRLR